MAIHVTPCIHVGVVCKFGDERQLSVRSHHLISHGSLVAIVMSLRPSAIENLPCSGANSVVTVAEWYRHRIVAGFVTSSSPVPLKTRRVGQRCTLNLSRAETSSRWCGVVVRRGGASSVRGSVAAVAEWYRYRTGACFVTGSSPVPLKTRRVGQRCTLNLSRAETSARWCGVVVRRGGASSGVVHVT
ncbi:uncharacterized protein TNCV_3164391 [Trichonephila clavipes]|nr:uncharacterized protein TNCV_3164391 [Trichonephila clavipes]